MFCALFPGLVAPHDPIFDNQFTPNLTPTWAHPFGTDTNGRDVFSRVLAGSRNVLMIAPAATLLGTLLGTFLGLVTGYLRGLVDDVASRLIDAVLSLPLIVTAILIVTAVGRSGTWVVVLIIGLIFSPVVSRTVRAAVLGEAELDYVQAARLRGERAPYIMFSEILPNVLSPVVVEFTVRLGYAIFTVASLTFIGFGVAPPSPGLGRADQPVLDADRSVLVDDVLPRPCDRQPGRRCQPRRGRDPRGVRAVSATMSTTVNAATAPALEVPTSSSCTPCAGSTGPSCAVSRSRSSGGAPTGSSASRVAASRLRRSPSSATSLATVGSPAAASRSPARTCSR